MSEMPNERLKRWRKECDLSLQQLADAADMSKGHLHHLEKDTEALFDVSYRNLCKLAACLGRSVTRLMRDS